MLRPTTTKKRIRTKMLWRIDLKLVGQKHKFKLYMSRACTAGWHLQTLIDLHQVGFAVSTADVEPTKIVRADQP